MRPNRLKLIKESQQAQAQEQGITYQQLVGDKKSSSKSNLENTKTNGQGSNENGQSHAMFHQLKAGMEVDLQRISSVSKMEEKIALKRELLPNYLTFVADYIAQGHDYPNVVAVQVLIWLMDVGDIEQALQLGFYLIRTPKQDLPAKFTRRDIPTFICDAVYDWASAELKANRSASPYLDQVVAVMLDEKWSLAPMVASKMPNMLAKHEMAKQNFENTVHWCDVAEQLNPEAHGTKTMRKEAVKKLQAKADAQAEGEK